MSLIPNNQRIHTVSANVDTTNRKSALLNSNVESVTMADITQTVNEEGPIKYYIAYYTADGGQGPWSVSEIYNTTGLTFTWSRAGDELKATPSEEITNFFDGKWAQCSLEPSMVPAAISPTILGLDMDYADIRPDGGSDAIFIGRANIDPTGTITDGLGFTNVLVLKRVINPDAPQQSGN